MNIVQAMFALCIRALETIMEALQIWHACCSDLINRLILRFSQDTDPKML